MSGADTLLSQLISTAIREDRVVRAGYTRDLATRLAKACGGSAKTDTEHEYWGDDVAGYWRIHLTK